jgi:hypothetical protein
MKKNDFTTVVFFITGTRVQLEASDKSRLSFSCVQVWFQLTYSNL